MNTTALLHPSSDFVSPVAPPRSQLSDPCPSESPTSLHSEGGAYHMEVRWCWQETPVRMKMHPSVSIVGDMTDCMIAYPKNVNDSIETAFQAQKGSGEFSPLPNYTVNFDTMTQTNTRTGYQREIRRVIDTEALAIPVPCGAGDAPLADCSPASNGNVQEAEVPEPTLDRYLSTRSGDEGMMPSAMHEFSNFVSPQNNHLSSPVKSNGSTLNPAPTFDAPQYYSTISNTAAPSVSAKPKEPRYRHRKSSSPKSPTNVVVRWCWRETPVRMPNHSDSSVVGDPSQCWISYDKRASETLEKAWNKQRQKGTCKPGAGYTVNFVNMKQTNNRTGYKRDVQRVLIEVEN